VLLAARLSQVAFAMMIALYERTQTVTKTSKLLTRCDRIDILTRWIIVHIIIISPHMKSIRNRAANIQSPRSERHLLMLLMLAPSPIAEKPAMNPKWLNLFAPIDRATPQIMNKRQWATELSTIQMPSDCNLSLVMKTSAY
jgi:hypothetical protein